MLSLNRHNGANLRLWNWLFILAVAWSMSFSGAWYGAGSADRLQAQEEKKAAPAAEPAAEEPAAEEGTEEEATEEEAAAAPAPGRSYLMWILIASGPFGACIAIESFILVALISMNMMQFRRENFLPAALIEGFEQKINAKDYQGAYELAKSNDSYLGRILTAGMANLNKGYEEATEAMQEAGDEEAMNLDHKLSYIGLIVATAPMLGLLGTVQGMIDSFRVIAESETSPKPKELAEGIMTALVTTMEGLVVAIPAIFAFGLFKNKVSRLQFEVGVAAEGLMKRFSAVGKKTAGAPASSTAPPSA